MVWLSFLVVLRSVTLSYVQENKLLFMGHKIGEKGKLYAFCFILVREDLQN